VQYESDRARFLGRGRGVRTPLSVIDGGPLSNTVGTVLDPIVSLRQRVSVPRGRTVSAVLTTLVASSRDEAIEIAEKYRDPTAFERESSLAWTHAQVQLHHLRISQDEAHLYQRLANRLLYLDPSARAAPEVLARTARASASCGSTASPGTCRSRWCTSNGRRTATSSGSSCTPTSTGG
jgi:cyclic beta-1,2-glucan synthetase